MQSETGDAYTGTAYVTTSGRLCRPWSSSNCQVREIPRFADLAHYEVLRQFSQAVEIIHCS